MVPRYTYTFTLTSIHKYSLWYINTPQTLKNTLTSINLYTQIHPYINNPIYTNTPLGRYTQIHSLVGTLNYTLTSIHPSVHPYTHK